MSEPNIDQKEEKEIWLPVPDEEFADLYEISNLGNYRNARTLQVLKPYKAAKYLMATLCKPGRKAQRYLVHRLVACAFVEDPEDKEENDVVNHKDGNKFNNKASNLEWTTLSANTRHSINVLGQKKTTKMVIKTDEKGFETTYDGIDIAAKKEQIRRQYIAECLRGKRAQYNNCTWRYVDPKHNVVNVNLNTMTEIKDFPGYYINEEGKVYGRSKKQYLTHNTFDGYPKVMLYVNSKPKSFYVHVLVAKHFIPNPENKNVVDHIDGNKMNCHVSNLRWVTSSENTRHSYNMRRNLSVLRQNSNESVGSEENSEVEVQSDNE